jgi:hypothetical protein
MYRIARVGKREFPLSICHTIRGNHAKLMKDQIKPYITQRVHAPNTTGYNVGKRRKRRMHWIKTNVECCSIK